MMTTRISSPLRKRHARLWPILLGASLFLCVRMTPGWSATDAANWEEFATALSSWKEGSTPDQPLEKMLDTLKMTGSLPDRVTVQVVFKMFRLAHAEQRAGYLERSELLYTKAFHWLENRYSPDDMILLDPLIELSSLWLAKEDHSRVIQALNRGLRIIEKNDGEFHLFATVIHERLATLYAHMGKPALAEHHEKQLLYLWQQANKPNSIVTAVIEKDQLAWLWQEGKDDSAMTHIAKIMAILTKNNGPYREAGISLMLPLVQHSATMKDEEKIRALKDYLLERENTLGDKHPGLIPVLLELAHLHQKRGELSLASPLLHRSLQLVNEFFGQNHPGIAQIYLDLAENHRLLQQDEEALSFYGRATAILRGRSGEYGTILLPILAGQTSIYKKRNQIVQAEQSQMETLTLLAQTPHTPESVLEAAQTEHKELVALLRQKENAPEQPETLKFKALVALMQRELAHTGLDPGPADGELGSKTVKAMHDFAKRIGLPASPTITKQSLLRLLEHLPP
ncbi:MAG: tetratricopeptide repeat protein [Magnetococcales bacterium]|nr:tetratricopeptide repeat protein [Magnetococcales bacterium]